MRRKNSTPPDRGQEDQSITVGGLGSKGANYKTRVRAVTHEGVQSEWTNEVQFTLTDSTEGTASDPNLPNTVTNVVIRGMLNAIYVEFDDEFFSTTKPLMSHNMGSYEIEISNAVDQTTPFPSTGNSWTQEFTGYTTTGPPGVGTRKFKVPTGDGFICTGMKSTEAGLTHYVRVRGVNADGEASADWSTPTQSVVLDTDDIAQTAVILAENAIFATHVKAGTLTATEIAAGTITATKISAGEVFASSIQLPASSGAARADEFAATRKFTIDLNGNVWWGNYGAFDRDPVGEETQAEADADSAFHNNNSYISAAGNARFVGTVATGAGDSDGNILALGAAGEARMVLGDSAGSVLSGGDSDGGYGYLLGYTDHTNEGLPGHVVFTQEDSGATGAGYIVAPRYQSGTFNYAGVRLRHRTTGNGEAILIVPDGASWAGMVLGTDENSVSHAESTFGVKAPGGIYIHDDNAPSPYANRLYSVSGSLYWNGTAVGGGGSSLTFSPSGALSGTNLASVDVDGDAVTVWATKTITTTSDTGRKGLSISTGDQASSGVSLEFYQLDATTPSSGTSHYAVWGYQASGGGGGVNHQFKVSFNNLATFMADLAGFTSKYLTISTASSTYMTASTIASTYLTSAAASATYATAGHNHDASYLQLSAGTGSKLTGHLYLDGGDRKVISEDGGLYMRASDENCWGVTAFADDHSSAPFKTALYYGQNTRILVDNTRIAFYTNPTPSGTLYYSLGTSSYYWSEVYHDGLTAYSDQAAKTDIADSVLGLDFVKGLRPVSYKWKERPDDNGGTRAGVRTHHGFIAQEVGALLGDDASATALWTTTTTPAQSAVAATSDGAPAIPAVEESTHEAIRITEFIPILTKALQELEARVAALEG